MLGAKLATGESSMLDTRRTACGFPIDTAPMSKAASLSSNE